MLTSITLVTTNKIFANNNLIISSIIIISIICFQESREIGVTGSVWGHIEKQDALCSGDRRWSRGGEPMWPRPPSCSTGLRGVGPSTQQRLCTDTGLLVFT